MFLAFSDVEASFLFPCFLDVHHSFSFNRHPSSVSVTLHRHFVFSRRSFLGDARVKSLSSWIITCSSCTHLSELGRTCFGGMKRNKGLTCLFPRGSSIDSGPRMCPDDVSGNLSLLEIEPCDHRLQFPCQCRLKSRLQPRVLRGFLIWNCVMERRNWQVH